MKEILKSQVIKRRSDGQYYNGQEWSAKPHKFPFGELPYKLDDGESLQVLRGGGLCYMGNYKDGVIIAADVIEADEEYA